MVDLREYHEILLTHPLTDMGPIPSVCDPDGVYPYASFAETSRRPVLKRYRLLALENEFLRVIICPDLGGKVHSLVDKRSGQEALFVPESIHPVRILPRLGFIAGGIEVSFPISHTPIQLETVDFEARHIGDRTYVWCGERELHFGMHWTVEYSLGPTDTYLTQRTWFRNETAQAHSWMSWSNAAVAAHRDTEFHFPGGPVLSHGAELNTIDWTKEGPRGVRDLNRMAGFFWLQPDAAAFGVFTPSRQQGLYHVADPAVAPGIKLWSYGVGNHEIWGQAAGGGPHGYLEIQGGPIRDQSIKHVLQPGQSHSHSEFWIPSSTPLNIRAVELPRPEMIPAQKMPKFDWPPRPELSIWHAVLEAYSRSTRADLPQPPELEQNLWAPSGMELLGPALGWARSITTGATRNSWSFQLGTWLAATGQIDQALEVLSRAQDDRAHALAARLLFREKKDPQAAVDAYRRIQSHAVAAHPQVVFERDRALAGFGPASLAEREQWLAHVGSGADEWLVERRAQLLLDQGKPQAARALLENTQFQLVHQRYDRTRLWNRVKKALDLSQTDPPNWLGEDDLASFGAYREFEDQVVRSQA